MAFWKIYSKNWYKRKDIPNMIDYYKEILFNQWYYSLPVEEKEKYDKYIRDKREKEKINARRALMELGIISSLLNHSYFLKG